MSLPPRPSRRWSALWGVALVALGAWSGCGSMALSCDFDSDCAADQLCVERLCMRSCTSDEDCAAQRGDPEGQTCQPYETSERPSLINVCATPGSLREGKTGDACQTSQECRDRLGEPSARCGLSGTCIIPAQEHSLLITDASQGGLRLMAAYLEDERGQAVAHARVEAYSPQDQQPSPQTSLFDGSPAMMTPDGACVQDTTPHQVQLGGQGGQVRISFVDARARQLLWQRGWRAVIIARGSPCQPDEPPAEYHVAACVSPSGEPVSPARDCSTVLGSMLMGRSVLDLPMTR